ncbi:hypothetical protein C8Q78DRAFT_1077602 [Trametes maxima]|nr:hypothetical protein C8Q78DRAFT_1077602 [Trametes maxima]
MFGNVGADGRKAAWSVEDAKTRRGFDSPFGLGTIGIVPPIATRTSAMVTSESAPPSSVSQTSGDGSGISLSAAPVIQPSQITTTSTTPASTSDSQSTSTSSISTPPPTTEATNTPSSSPSPSPTEEQKPPPPPPPTTSTSFAPSTVSQETSQKDSTTPQSSLDPTVVSVSRTASVTTVWMSSEPSPTELQAPTARPERTVNVVEIVAVLVACVIVLVAALLGCWLWRRKRSPRAPYMGAGEKSVLGEGQRASLIAPDDDSAGHPVAFSRTRGPPANAPEIDREGYGFYPRSRDAVVTPYLIGSSTSLLHTVARGQQFPVPVSPHREAPTPAPEPRPEYPSTQTQHPRCRLLPVRSSEKNASRFGAYVPPRWGEASRGWIQHDAGGGSEVNHEPPPEYSRY